MPAATALLFGLLAACDAKETDTDLTGWHRSETLWRSHSGRAVALYKSPTEYNSDKQAIVCEGDRPRKLYILPIDTFQLISGSYVTVFNPVNRTTPGWYKIHRNHNLNWWQRTFSDETLGGWEAAAGPPEDLVHTQRLGRGGVFLVDGGVLVRIADESKLRDLFDAPAEGLVYVAEPGIGVRASIDLAAACP